MCVRVRVEMCVCVNVCVRGVWGGVAPLCILCACMNEVL